MSVFNIHRPPSLSTLCKPFSIFSETLILFFLLLLIFLLLTPLRLNCCSSDSKTNLPKYAVLHLSPPALLKILASFLTNILPSVTKLHLSPQPVTVTSVNFAVRGLTSIRQPHVPLLPPSLTVNLTTVILSTINSLSLNYPVSIRSRTLLLILSLNLLRPVISLSSYTLSPLVENHWTHRIQAPPTDLFLHPSLLPILIHHSAHP